MSQVESITLPSDATAIAKPGPLSPPPADETPQKASGEQQQQQQQDAPVRPEHVPEKFWKDGKVDTDALLKSYSELEKKNSTPPKEGDKGKENPPKEGDATPPANVPPEEVFKPFVEEFAKDGKLSEESFKKLTEEHKLPRAVVEQYLKGIEATRTAAESEVFNSVGGQENYSAMTEWAKGNLNAEEIAAYNEALDSGKLESIKLAVSGLYQRFTAAEGRPAATRLRGGNGGSNLTPFKSTAEVTEAMRDARYNTDADYRKEVAERIRISSVL